MFVYIKIKKKIFIKIKKIVSYKRHSSIGNSSNGLLHTLSKQLLTLIDVFIFSIRRCFPVTNVPFSLLKNLKDGEAISLKYDSKTLSFKTPTKVIIFSNTWADRKKMLLDRWKYSTLNKMS